MSKRIKKFILKFTKTVSGGMYRLPAIPKDQRELLGWKDGDVLQMKFTNKSITITKVK